jgi:hypothetical protein
MLGLIAFSIEAPLSAKEKAPMTYLVREPTIAYRIAGGQVNALLLEE